MAVIEISEYNDLPKDKNGDPIQAGDERNLVAEAQHTVSGTSAQHTLNADTRFVRISVSGITAIAFGSNPTATTNAPKRLPADHVEYFGVTGGSKIAYITTT